EVAVGYRHHLDRETGHRLEIARHQSQRPFHRLARHPEHPTWRDLAGQSPPRPRPIAKEHWHHTHTVLELRVIVIVRSGRKTPAGQEVELVTRIHEVDPESLAQSALPTRGLVERRLGVGHAQRTRYPQMRMAGQPYWHYRQGLHSRIACCQVADRMW